MSGEAYEILALLMRYVFALIGALIVFRSFIWLRKDARAYRKEMKTLPDAGLVGEIVDLDTVQFDCPFLCKRGNFIRFGDKIFFILTQKQKIWKGDWESGLRIDCLFLRQNPRMDPEELLAIIPFQEVMADASNTPFYIDRWRVFCKENSIPFTYTGDCKMNTGG
jgi:hypothetical protein